MSSLGVRNARHAAIPNPTIGLAGPLRLEPRHKVHTSDGGHRALDQRDALAQLERHLSPVTGIVSSLAIGERAGDRARKQRLPHADILGRSQFFRS